MTGPLQPGRYFLDAMGNAGLEGGPALINLRQASSRSTSHAHRIGGVRRHVGGDGNFGYYMDSEGRSVTFGQ